MIELSWCRIPSLNRFLCDYASGEVWLEQLLSGDASTRAVAVSAIEAIEETMQPFQLSPQQRRNLERLRSGAAVVIGGQQVGFLGGPLYTWLKIASIVRAACDEDAVPVFWVEDNDHDAREAQRVGIIAPGDEVVQLECPQAEPAPPQTIVAERIIGQQVTELIEHVVQRFSGWPFAEEVAELMRAVYVPGRRWVEAFVEWHQQVWAAEGLLFVRASVLRQAGAMQQMIERHLRSGEKFAELVRRQTAELQQRGYTAQAEVSTFAAFVHDGGQRFRLHADGNSVRWGRHRATIDDVVRLLHSEPQRFSPAALLRPLVQDALFAPRVTVLGPAELQYHAQLRAVYSAWKVPRAQLRLRHSATILPHRIMRTLEHVPVEVFLQPLAQLQRWIASQLDSADVLGEVAAIEGMLAAALERLQVKARSVDPTLAPAVGAAEHALLERLDRLAHTIRRTLRRTYAQRTQHYYAAATHLWPNGGLQERTISPIHWLCQLGIEGVRRVLCAVAEYSNRVHLIGTPDDFGAARWHSNC